VKSEKFATALALHQREIRQEIIHYSLFTFTLPKVALDYQSACHYNADRNK
jgi:hypothetical protein